MADPAATEPQPRPAVDAPLVLIVDDDPDFARLLTLSLRANGLRAESTSSALGLSARLLASPTVSVVALDCVMPALSGPAIIDLLARNARLQQTPIVLMSALPDYAAAVSGHPRAVFVEKNGHAQNIVAAVLALLGRAPTPEA